MTDEIGTINEFMKWTKQVITDPAAAADTPKRWFDLDETALKSLGTSTSPEAVVKLLSKENIDLVGPGSVVSVERWEVGQLNSH
jgi:hypothetical protein